MNARGDDERPENPEATGDEPGGSLLHPSDAWFRSVVEAANEGIWIIDREARTIFANERMAALLGSTPEKMIGTRPFDYLDQEDLADARAIMQANYEGRPVEFEIRFRRLDGTYIPVLAGSAPLRDDSGEVIGSVATFSDLTEREAVEKALQASEREARETATLFRQLLESSSDAIWLRDPEGRFQLANPSAAKILGGTPQSLVGKSMYEVWGEEFSALLAEQSRALFERGTGELIEEEVADAGSGGRRIFLSNKVPLFHPDGRPLGILGVSRDVTEYKRTEDALRRSQEQLAHQLAELNALYASAPIGLAFFSRDYRYIRINEELAAINGVPVEDHIGRTIREVLSDSAPPVEPIIDSVYATGESVRIETSGETPQQPGVIRHWLAGFYPVKDGGDVQAVGAWVIEISERKAAEERETLLAREVDHRAKNLLAVVQSIVTLTPAEDAEALKTSIVGRIQALARAHSLLSDSRWDGVDLGQLIREELAPFAAGGRVTFDGPAIVLRPPAAQSLALVLHELVTNAAKYGALSAGRGKLSVTWNRHGGWIVIDWCESGSSAVHEPDRTGFGSQIIRASVERQLRGQFERLWLADGVRCTLRIPAAEAVPQAE